MAPMRVGCPAILIALLAGLAAPISVKGDQIDDYIKAQMRQLHIPGASLAIVRDGHIAKAQGYGFANLELQASARKDTVYEIGSTSKQFTAAAIMMLVEEDKVRLEDPITKYFTEAPQRRAASQSGTSSPTHLAFKTMSRFRIGLTFSGPISLLKRPRREMSC